MSDSLGTTARDTAPAARGGAGVCSDRGSLPDRSAPAALSVPTEELHRVPNACHETVDLVQRVVHGERRPRRRGDAESPMQRPRAVVTHPYCDAVVIEDLSDVVSVDALDHERHWRAPVLQRLRSD